MNNLNIIEFANNEESNIPDFDKYVLHNLRNKFIDSSIYYKPSLNFDTPDILILEQGKGAILIDICPFNLEDYRIVDKDTFTSIKKNNTVLSPVRKLLNYKSNLFKSHINGLLEAKVKNKSVFSIIKNVVIFEHTSHQSIMNFFGSDVVEYTKLFSKDNFLNIQNLYNSDYCTTKIYNGFLDALSKKVHTKDDGKSLNYSKKQQDLSISKAGEFKIRGVAGAGKTYILARRAVLSHIRHSGHVLILTYNKSLKRYIKYKLDEVEEDFDYKYFHIDNYHNFISVMNNNLYLVEDSTGKINHGKFPKFKSIFIDEVQDYETDWIRNIKDNFLAEDGELVVFGDEKQNVYDRELDNNKKVNTTIIGRWNELKESFRFNGKIVDLTNAFQDVFLSEKYEVSKIEKKPSLDFSEEYIEYIYFDENSTPEELAYAIHLKINNDNLKLRDISIIGSRIHFLQELDYIFRKELHRKTQTIFESKEYLKNYGHNKISIDEIRGFKKNQFDIYSDNIKLSTIKSFKGYEAETLFFVITADDNIDEEIYTAFTRSTKNLYIININNNKYDDFFKKNIRNVANLKDRVTLEIEESISVLSTNNLETARLKNIIKELENKYQEQKKEVKETQQEKQKLQVGIQHHLQMINDELQIGKVIKYVIYIEELLIENGAEKWESFIEKIKTIETSFPSLIIDKLHFIRKIRNSVAHSSEFQSSSFLVFEESCEYVIKALKDKKV